MILVRCIKDVYGESEHSYIDFLDERCLFKAGYFYIVNIDGEGRWLTRDEEDEPHIIADGQATLKEDDWFHEHFVIA